MCETREALKIVCSERAKAVNTQSYVDNDLLVVYNKNG